MDVFVVIRQWLFDGFAHGLEAGEVHDGGDGVTGEALIEHDGVADVAFDEAGTLAAEGFQPVDDIGATVAEIVEYEQVIDGLRQGNARVRADAARCSWYRR
jgi:hypothetical protein